jgi:hypothetical protein
METMGGRFFWPFGIALNKTSLYDFGARPVLNGDDELRRSLPDEMKYLWSRYDPRPDPRYTHPATRSTGYPRDFMHEREWRCRPRKYSAGGVSWDLDGVPLLLPGDMANEAPAFALLVFRQEDADALKAWLPREWNTDHQWLRRYCARLPQAPVIIFDQVRKNLRAGNLLWTRVETSPMAPRSEHASA